MGPLSALALDNVVVVETIGHDCGRAVLPEEMLAIGEVADTRRQDFCRGRTCARRALEVLGCAAHPILIGLERQPLWPDGFIGSITHCNGYCAAAVAPANQLASIGIDAEPHAPLPDGVLQIVSLPEERAWLENPPDPAIHWDRVLFCAKESIYKAWFPLTRKWLDFHDVSVGLAAEPCRFTANVGGAEPVMLFHGRFAVLGGFVATAVFVPHTAPRTFDRTRLNGI